MVPSLKLDVFSVRGEERAFGAMLGKVSEQMFRHADDQELVAEVGTYPSPGITLSITKKHNSPPPHTLFPQVAKVLVFCAEKGPSGLQVGTRGRLLGRLKEWAACGNESANSAMKSP